MILSYKYRIEPNQTQAAALDDMLGDFCQLYNAGLEQRIAAYRRQGISVTYKMQADELKAVRCAAPELARWSFSAEQQVLRRLDKTFKAFFARGHGFPRFRAIARFHAAEFRVGDGLTLRKSGKIGFVGVPGEIKLRWHRALPSKPKSAILTRQAGNWYVVFHVEVAAIERSSPDSIGIDLGLSSLAALSNGKKIPRPNITKRNAKKLRRLQRALARCKRGSNIRRKRKAAVAKLQAYIGNARRDRFGRIAVEDLNINGLASGIAGQTCSRRLVGAIDRDA
jgi:putative transposase